MKPSERITELQSTTIEGYGHIEEAAGFRVRNLSMADEANAKADAIILYLDEQHAAELARANLNAALAMLRHGYVASDIVNEMLVAGGLTARAFEKHVSEDVIRAVVAEAKEKGLL